MGNWIQLRSGGGYDFESKSIFGRYTMEVDLAKCLDEIVRCGGHASVRWTVAQHSVAVGLAMLAITRSHSAAAAGLLHDAHEAIIGDITTPVALEIGYDKVKAVKVDVQAAIEQRLAIPQHAWPSSWVNSVRKADAAALHIERQLFLVPTPRPWAYAEPTAAWTQALYDATLQVQASSYSGAELFTSFYREWLV